MLLYTSLSIAMQAHYHLIHQILLATFSPKTKLFQGFLRNEQEVRLSAGGAGLDQAPREGKGDARTIKLGRRDPCGRSHRSRNGLPVELERQTSGQHQ